MTTVANKADQQLDLSAFDEPVTAADKTRYKVGRNKVVIFVAIISGVLFLIPIVVVSLFLGNIAKIITVALIVGLSLLAKVAYSSYVNKTIRLKKFAAANNFDYIDSHQPIARAGAIFNTGSSRHYASGFASKDGALSLANYQYTISGGRSSQTISWGVMRAKLTRNLPNVILDATSNNTFGKFSNLPESFSGGQKFELEGDFNKYFSVLAPKGYQRDALYFLTPELMQALVEYGKDYDFEIVDDNLYIYKSGAFKFNKEMLPHIVQTIKYFGWQFEDNVRRYNDDRVENAKVANVVSTDGRRLKHGAGWVGVVLFVIYLIFWFMQIIR